MRGIEGIAAATVGTAALVLALKGAAWWITGSAGLYSDALESVVNVAAAVALFVAVRFAGRPADSNHPYGHGKAELFAAVAEGVLIVLAAAAILARAWTGWVAPQPIETPWTGLALNGVATLVNAAWAARLLRSAKAHRSAALAADGRHLLADVATSVGVIAGVGAAVLTGLAILDPIVAALTAVQVLWSGVSVIGRSVGGLMDAAPAEPVVARVRQLVGETAFGALEAHDLRMRHAGRQSFLEFHLVVPGRMTVDDAHGICDRVEDALKREVPGLTVTIHVEPEGKAKHHGVVVL